MAISFADAVKATAPAVFDATLAAHNGASSMGIGLTGADGAALTGAQHIGNKDVPVVKFDTNKDSATP